MLVRTANSLEALNSWSTLQAKGFEIDRSLVPNLPQLCRQGEPGIFYHVNSVKGRKEGSVSEGSEQKKKNSEFNGKLSHITS